MQRWNRVTVLFQLEPNQNKALRREWWKIRTARGLRKGGLRWRVNYWVAQCFVSLQSFTWQANNDNGATDDHVLYTQLPHPRPHLPSLAPFTMAELDPDFLFPPVILTSMKSQARLKGSELPSRVTFYLLNAKKHWRDFHGVPKGHRSGVHLGINWFWFQY